MKTDVIFTQWCASVVPVLIGHMVQDYASEGGSFFLEAKTTMMIKGAEGIGFELPLPDNIVDIDNPQNISKEGLDIWIKLVSDHIYQTWDKSYNGKKHKLLDDLKTFSIIYPKMAQDLLNSVVFRDGEFIFDTTRSQYGEIALMVAKFDDFKTKRQYNVKPL